jgi:hypothetical protein
MEFFSFLIFFIFLFWLSYYHEDLQLTIIFDLFHLHIYRCELQPNRKSTDVEQKFESQIITKTVVSKKNMEFECGNSFYISELGDEYLIEIKKDDSVD